MSHRMCALCNKIIDNRIYNSDHCPYCGSLEMCDPNEHNNEWEIMCKQQQIIDQKDARILDLEKKLKGKNIALKDLCYCENINNLHLCKACKARNFE